MTGVSDKRWQEAQEAERRYWSTEHFALEAFRATVCSSMETASWASSHLEIPAGDWLEIGVGPLGVGCAHFLKGEALHTLDPIETISPDAWQLPEPCKVLVRACHERTVARHVGQAEHIDFEDDAFALVVLHNVLDHVQDPRLTLQEVRRVLRPGGHLLLAIDTFSVLGEAKYRFITRRLWRDTILVRAHPHRFSSGDVVRVVGAAGLRIVQADTPGRAVALTGRCYRVRLLAT